MRSGIGFYSPSSAVVSHMKRMAVDALMLSDCGQLEPSFISSTGFPSRTCKVVLAFLHKSSICIPDGCC